MSTNTTETMSKTLPKRAALAAPLGRLEWIGELNTQSNSLCFVDTRLRHLFVKPRTDLSTGSFSLLGRLFDLLYVQVFKDKNRVFRSPFAEHGRGFFTECHISVMMFPTQPFKHTSHASRVFPPLKGRISLPKEMENHNS